MNNCLEAPLMCFRGLFFLLLLSAAVFGQETRGMIHGLVIDAQSAAVSGAIVTVTNTETGVRRDLTTNTTGYYEARLLLAGPYVVTVQATGFKKAIRSGL